MSNQELNDYLLRKNLENAQLQAQREIADHERLSQPFRKVNLQNALIGGTIGAGTGALAGSSGGPIGAGLGALGGGIAGGLTPIVTDVLSNEWKEGTMQPPNYDRRNY